MSQSKHSNLLCSHSALRDVFQLISKEIAHLLRPLQTASRKKPTWSLLAAGLEKPKRFSVSSMSMTMMPGSCP